MSLHSSPSHPWLQPQWPHIPGVHALFTTREGGVSQAPFDSMNVGDHVRDQPRDVQRNRQRLQAVIQSCSPAARAVFLQQVHGCDVALLGPATPQGLAADACVAQGVGQVCTIMVADCLPVLFAHPAHRVVAAAHAGWRGLAGHGGQGVLESTVQRFLAQTGSGWAWGASESEAVNTVAPSASGVPQAPQWVPAHASTLADMQVWLGPCIGPDAFEVGEEVRAAFVAQHPEAQHCFRPGATAQKWWADLAGLARLRLQRMGISRIYGNDSTSPWCTVTQESQYFSHRRDAAALGSTGRMAACIWLDA